MRFQLVVQFEANSVEDFDRLVHFEGNLAERLGALGEIDGHDFGSGEFNVFVFTDDPLAAFEKSCELIRSQELRGPVRAAYRKRDAEDFVILWPPDLST